MTDYWDHPEYKKLEKENEQLAAMVAELEGALSWVAEHAPGIEVSIAEYARKKVAGERDEG